MKRGAFVLFHVNNTGISKMETPCEIWNMFGISEHVKVLTVRFDKYFERLQVVETCAQTRETSEPNALLVP